MYFPFILLDSLSLVIQATAAFLAIRLIRITGANRAWIMIAVALLAMAVRRLVVLAGVIGVVNNPNIVNPVDDVLGLVNAILILVGIASIGPLFRSVQEAKDSAQRAHDQLEKDVQQRTADLVAAHEKLQAEFAQRAKAEEALRDEHHHLRQVLEMFERDQRLLAYEIHDGFVQPATASLMNLQAGLSAYATNPDKALENVIRGLQLLQESISQVRWLMSGLRSAVLEDEGLVAAVDNLVGNTKLRTDIQIEWTHQVQFDRLAPPLEMSLFRIIQEALRNAVRHSRTRRIEIALTETGGTVTARIQDWGCGFDAAVRKPDHFGLEAMHERARLFGGAARIESAPGEGTCVTVEFPLAEKEAVAQN
jgi:two-component system sensor histidine kinase DegS